jgi:hypothetical protein
MRSRFVDEGNMIGVNALLRERRIGERANGQTGKSMPCAFASLPVCQSARGGAGGEEAV